MADAEDAPHPRQVILNVALLSFGVVDVPKTIGPKCGLLGGVKASCLRCGAYIDWSSSGLTGPLSWSLMNCWLKDGVCEGTLPGGMKGLDSRWIGTASVEGRTEGGMPSAAPILVPAPHADHRVRQGSRSALPPRLQGPARSWSLEAQSG
jgi:hypothetical protein